MKGVSIFPYITRENQNPSFMKKFNLYLILMIMVIWGCSTFDDSAQLPDARITQLFTLNATEQRLAFEILNSKEKAKVWTLSVSNALRRDNFSTRQRDVVQELLNFIGQDMPNDENVINAFKDSWLKKADGILDDEKIYSVAFKINSDVGINTEDPDDPTGPQKCNCNRGAFWTCGPITVESWCPDAPSNCRNPTITGCGFLWSYPCNQICVFEPV